MSSALDKYVSRSTNSNAEYRPAWPDKQTAAAVLSVGINGFFELAKASIPMTQIGNLPVRIWSTLTAFQQKEYVHVARNVVSFSALFFPHGRPIAIGVDMMCECMSAYQHLSYKTPRSNLKNKLDPSIKENALRILDLSAEEAQDPSRVTEKARQMVDTLNQRKAKASPIIAQELQWLIEDIQAACRTLNGDV